MFGNPGNNDLLSDMPMMMNQHMNALAYPSQFFMFERWTLPSTLKELYLYSAHAYMTNDALNPAIEKLAEYPVTDFTFHPIVKAPQGSSDYEDEVKEKSKITTKWKDIFDHHQVKGKAISWSMNYYIYGLNALSIYQPFDRSLVCPNCRAQYRLKEIKYRWDQTNLQFVGTCKTCNKGVTFRVKDKPLADPYRINVMSFYPGDLDVDYDKTSGCYDVYWNIDQQTMDKIKKGNKLQLEKTPKEIIDAVRVSIKKRIPARVKFKEDNIFLMVRRSADFPDWPSVLGMPITIAALRGINHLNMMRRAQTALLMEHILPFRFVYPQHQDNPSTLLDLGSWRGQMQKEIKQWKKDPLYIMISPIQLGYDQIGGQGKALLLYPEIEQQRLGIIQSMNVPQEFVTGGLSYSGSSVSLRMLENQMINHVEQLTRAVRWIIKRISQISGLEYVDVKMAKFKMADDVQAKGQLIQMNSAQQISLQKLGEELGFDAQEMIEQMSQEKLDRALSDAVSQAKGMAHLNKIQTLMNQILPPDLMNAYPMMDPQIIDSYYQAMSSYNPEQQQAILQNVSQNNPGLARQLETKRHQDPMAAFQTMQQITSAPAQQQPMMMEQIRQQDPATALLIAALAKQFQQPLFGQGPGMGGSPGDGQPGQNGETPQGTDMRPNPSQKPPRRENKTM